MSRIFNACLHAFRTFSETFRDGFSCTPLYSRQHQPVLCLLHPELLLADRPAVHRRCVGAGLHADGARSQHVPGWGHGGQAWTTHRHAHRGLVSQVSSRYTVVSSRYTVVSSRYTVVSSRYTVVVSRSTVVNSRYTVVSSRYTVVSPRYTVVSSRYTLVSSRYTVVSSRYTVVSSRYTVERPRGLTST